MDVNLEETVLEIINDYFNYYFYDKKRFPTFKDRIDATVKNIKDACDDLPDLLLSHQMYDMSSWKGFSGPQNTYKGIHLDDLEDMEYSPVVAIKKTIPTTAGPGFVDEVQSRVFKYYRSQGKMWYREDLAYVLISERGLLVESHLKYLPKNIKSVVDTFFKVGKDRFSLLWGLPQEILDQIVLNFIIDKLLFDLKKEYKESTGSDLDPSWIEMVLEGTASAPVPDSDTPKIDYKSHKQKIFYIRMTASTKEFVKSLIRYIVEDLDEDDFRDYTKPSESYLSTTKMISNCEKVLKDLPDFAPDDDAYDEVMDKVIDTIFEPLQNLLCIDCTMYEMMEKWFKQNKKMICKSSRF